MSMETLVITPPATVSNAYDTPNPSFYFFKLLPKVILEIEGNTTTTLHHQWKRRIRSWMSGYGPSGREIW